MEGYYGSGLDVFSVTQDQEPSDRLPSPDSWSRWGILHPGTFEGNVGAGGDRRFDLYLDLLDKYRPSYLDSPVEEETDDVFFNKNPFLTDLHSTPNEQKHETFCFCPQCDNDVFPAGDSWLDLISSPGLSKRAKKLVELEEQSFLASGDLNDGGSEIQTVPLNMKDYQLLEDSPSSIGTIVPSGQFGQYHQAISETPPEEVALEELKMVITLLSDRTRICFRDGLYRLADNSKQRPKRWGVQKGGSSIRKPVSWTDERSSKETNESKTNVVDRAIANIMFNRKDSNVQEDSLESVPADLNLVNLYAGEAQCSSSKLPLACHEENELQLSHEFEVPILAAEAGLKKFDRTWGNDEIIW